MKFPSKVFAQLRLNILISKNVVKIVKCHTCCPVSKLPLGQCWQYLFLLNIIIYYLNKK